MLRTTSPNALSSTLEREPPCHAGVAFGSSYKCAKDYLAGFSGDRPGSMRKISDVSILLLVLPLEFQRWSHIPFLVSNQVVCALELQHNESAYDRPPRLSIPLS